VRQPVVLQQPNKTSIQPKQHHNSLLAVRAVPVEDSFIAKLKAIICQESGIDLSELDLRTPLADYGIDSLLSLTITSRLQEDAGIKLSPSAFVEFATLGELIEHLAPSENRTTATSRSSTPALEEDEKDGAETEATSVTSEEPDVMEAVSAIIASEAGISREELTPTADLSEFGLDSLLSLNIIGRLSDIGIHIPTKLLIDSRNLHEVALGLSQKEALAKSQTSAMDAAGPPNGGVNGSRYHATSVRLQGSSGTHSKALFLFPDGAGSATSYLALPSLAHDISVYGLNCPWLKTPQDLRCTLPQYVSKFIVEIRRRQSTGPYYFGGWSAGGILAYEAAQQLARAGEAVEKLILFDTPDPVGIHSPPQRMYDFLESLDMFGMNGRKAPSWLRPHFTAFITMLDQYCPVAFAGTKTPATLLIYARDGLCKDPSDPRPEERPDDSREMKWLLNNRTDFEGGSWRRLVGAESLKIAVVDNANHYSLMNRADSAREVAAIVADYIVG
jgi:naphtho-gamma-pyrone polyketide synthase